MACVSRSRNYKKFVIVKTFCIGYNYFIEFSHVRDYIWNVNIFNNDFNRNELRTYEFNYTAEQIAEDEAKAEAEREKYFEDIESDQKAMDREDRNF